MQEQPADNLMVAISQPWYNGSYTMAAKPIKSLELHYTMIQFLIICVILCYRAKVPFSVRVAELVPVIILSLRYKLFSQTYYAWINYQKETNWPAIFSRTFCVL